MNLFCVGLSHHTANVETREHFPAAGKQTPCCAVRDAREALLLTTCNRVEVPCRRRKAYGDGRNRTLPFAARSTSRRGTLPCFTAMKTPIAPNIFSACASGLDSMVVGETGVLGQGEKDLRSRRASTGGPGPYLHRLFQRAFRAAKQVRTHTDITRGSVSVGSVAVDLAAKIFGRRIGKVLVLGAGREQRADCACARLPWRDRFPGISNRSLERATNWSRWSAASPFHSSVAGPVPHMIDILITSTASSSPLLTREFPGYLRDRIDRPLFIIDIAVPRNARRERKRNGRCLPYDIDSLQAVAEQTLALRGNKSRRRRKSRGPRGKFSGDNRARTTVAGAKHGASANRREFRFALRNVSDKLVLGTRGSELARTQARMVESALREKWSELTIETKIIQTRGDQQRGDFGIVDVPGWAEGIVHW